MKHNIFFYDDLNKKANKKQKESWGYFRPGFCSLKKDSIVPAMVYLGEKAYQAETDIHHSAVEFVLVKTNCYLKDWEDALFISEEDFNQINQISKQKSIKNKNPSDKTSYLMEKFTDKGYLPLSKIKSTISFTNLH